MENLLATNHDQVFINLKFIEVLQMNRNLSVYDICVFLSLVEYMNREEIPTQLEIADLIGVSDRQVRKSLKKLETCGWIKREIVKDEHLVSRTYIEPGDHLQNIISEVL